MKSSSKAFVSARCLLLNSSYEPMKIVTWQKALVLWFQNKVDVIEYHSIFARSVSSSFQIPSVLRLKSYVRPKSYGVVRFCRENVYIRDNFTCQYCAKKFSNKQLTLDHIIPASKSGPKSWTNVVAACRYCNQRKANRTPHVANMPLLKQPEIPSWLPTLDFQTERNVYPQNWLQYLRLKTG